MRANVLQIHWHDRQPVFSIDFDPRDPLRIATAGGDNNVRIWRLVRHDDGSGSGGGSHLPEYRATLARHPKSVNCVRFSHSGELLASAGDGGSVIFWRQSAGPMSQSRTLFGAEGGESDDEDRKEFWSPVRMMRTSDTADIYDLCWSPDDRHVLVGLTDNTAQIWDRHTQKRVRVLRDHQHFVQGVAWDPFGRYLVTESCDRYAAAAAAVASELRSVKIWHAAARGNGGLAVTPLCKLNRSVEEVAAEAVPAPASGTAVDRSHHIFHDETLVSFFRRPAFSPDGALLFLPAGIACREHAHHNCLYILARAQIGGPPVASIGAFDKPVLGVRCNPRLFAHPSEDASSGTGTDMQAGARAEIEPMFKLPYRIIYAAFTIDTVAVFDTRQVHPIVSCKDLHYGTLTDAAWSPDGQSLLVASTDGFCSALDFAPAELGVPLPAAEQTEHLAAIHAGLEQSKRAAGPLASLVEGELRTPIATSEPDESERPAPPAAPPATPPVAPRAVPMRRIKPTWVSSS